MFANQQTRRKLRTISVTFIVFLGLQLSSILLADESRPNILFILTDDQRWDSLGCYGNSSIKTPNIDKLSTQGVLLNNFYAATPLCCPSRANFLTGLYAHQTGITSNDDHVDIPQGTRTIANYLNEVGYVTGFIGKAHLGGDPRKWGFKHCPVVLRTIALRKNPRIQFDNYPKTEGR